MEIKYATFLSKSEGNSKNSKTTQKRHFKLLQHFRVNRDTILAADIFWIVAIGDLNEKPSNCFTCDIIKFIIEAIPCQFGLKQVTSELTLIQN